MHSKTHMMMNKIYSFIVICFLNLNFCSASSEKMIIDLKIEEQEEVSTSSNSSQGKEKGIIPISEDKFLKTIKEGVTDNTLHCFVFNIGQGNFIVLKFNQNIMIIDCGFQNATKESCGNFFKTNENTIESIFKQSSIKAVVVTHPDADHYNCLKYLLGTRKLDEKCVFITGREGEEDYNFFKKLPKEKHVLYAVESYTLYNDASIALTMALFGQSNNNGTIEILEPAYKIEAKDTNSHSLILKVTYDKQSILFTGDATKATFEAIYGDTKNEQVKNLSIKNRLALKSVNFLISPHHGASSAESNLWLMHVNAKNFYNFVGTIFCASNDTQHGHPGKYIDTIAFENKTFGHEFKYYYAKNQNSRQKASHEPIWVTGLTTYAYWLKLSPEDGMQIFNDLNGEFYTLLTKDGWSLKMQTIYDDLKKDNVPEATWGILLQNPRKWKCRNGKGQILSEALYANENKKFEWNISSNIKRYLEIILHKEHSLHKYYAATLTSNNLVKRYFKFPENPIQDLTKALKEFQQEVLKRKASTASNFDFIKE